MTSTPTTLAAPRAADWPSWHSPRTGQPLTRHDDVLRSPSGEVFPIVNGIPRFVSDGTYAESFGVQWNRFQRTQLDSYTGLPITRERLRRCVGSALWDQLAGQHVLECGCGAGRFTEVLLERGARVTSVDLSTAVDANARNFPITDSHRIAQADILALPFDRQQFDVVLCLGVIQHTPEPERTIAALYEQVKPGGTLVIDHYTFGLGRLSSVKPLVRAYLRRQPRAKAMAAVERLTDAFLPWHRRLRGSSLGWSLLCRISPITTYYRSIPELDDALQREWALLDTHDSLTDWFKHLRSREQIRRTLEELGAEDVWCEYGGNGVEARARRPLARAG